MKELHFIASSLNIFLLGSCGFPIIGILRSYMFLVTESFDYSFRKFAPEKKVKWKGRQEEIKKMEKRKRGLKKLVWSAYAYLIL